MSETGISLLARYLGDLIATERASESRYRKLSSANNDDPEILTLFGNLAEESRVQAERLSALQNSNSGSTLLTVEAPLVSVSDVVEEQTLHSLIFAYTVESGGAALYDSFATMGHAAGDTATEDLARQIQTEKAAAAGKIQHFLPSRSKIAFNMLTVSEIDPAVETKIADDRLIGS